MRLYLGPESSLELIRYLRALNGSAGLEGKPIRKRALKDSINTVVGIEELDATAQFWLQHVSEPIGAFVDKRERGTKTTRLITQVLSAPVANGCFLDLGHNVCVCTPQFAFLRLGATKDTLELLAIGMELCGHYSRWREENRRTRALRFGDREGFHNCTFQLPPVMSIRQATAFVSRMQGQRGAVGARKCLRWVLDNSASPMESATYLLLCLPRKHGGYGLPQPTLNPLLRIKTPEGEKMRYPDLYWSEPGIDVEYNSDESHSGEWSRYRDSKREVELVAAQVQVLPLTRPQLMDVDEFDAFAQSLRKLLGIRQRPHAADWTWKRAQLRWLFLTGGKT